MTRIIAYATMSVGFATALAGVFPSLGIPLMKDIIVTVILVLLAIVNLLGLELYKIVQNAATIAKIIPFILFIGMGIFYIQPANFEPFFPGGTYTPEPSELQQ